MLTARISPVITLIPAAACCSPNTRDEDERSLYCDEIAAVPRPIAEFSAEIEPFPCDPLSPPMRQIVPTPPVLVGQSSRGDVFIAERVLSTFGLFVGDNSHGFRRLNAGVFHSYSDGSVNTDVFSILGEGEPAGGAIRTPIRQTAAGPFDFASSQFAVFYGELPSAERPELTFDQGERLEPVNDCSSVLEQMPMSGMWFSGDEHVAVTDDGDHFVLVRLLEFVEEPLEYKHFVFFGPAHAVQQREVRLYSRKKNGEARIEFDVDGTMVTAWFPQGCEESRLSTRCPGKLSAPGQRDRTLAPLELLYSSAPSMSFLCRFTWRESLTANIR